MDDRGLMVPAWTGRRRQRAAAYVKRLGEREGAPCCLCGQAIDYSLTYPDPASCSLQHVLSQRDFPHLRWEPTNWAPAHLRCNQAAGADGGVDLGVVSD